MSQTKIWNGRYNYLEPPSSSQNDNVSRQCPLRKKLQELFDEGTWCDLTVIVEEEYFHCHAIVLISISEYFDGLLRSRPKFSVEPTTIINISADIFDEILKFAYYNEKPSLTGSNIYDFFCASDFLGIHILIDHCEQYIYDHMSSIENIFEIFSFARAMNNEMSYSILDYIIENFTALLVSQREEFLTMSLYDLLIILDKYSSPNQGPNDPAALSRIFRDENLLLDLLIRWLKYFPEDKSILIVQISRMVDFGKISPNYLELLAKQCELDSSVDSVSFKESLCDHLSFNECINLSTIPFERASKSELHVYMHHETKSSRYSSTQLNVFSTNKYDPKWRLSDRKNPSEVLENLSKIIALGESPTSLYRLEFISHFGHCPIFSTSTSITLDPKKTLANPPIDVHFDFFDMCGMPNSSSIYSYFYENNARMVKVMEYNCQLDTWSPVRLREKISRACMLADNNLLYLIGGFHPNKNAQCVQFYDPRAPNWMNISKTNHRYYDAAGTSLHGKIYVSDARTTEVLDPVAGKWETVSYAYPLTDTTDFEGRIQMVAYDEKIWLICSTESVLESYDSYNHGRIMYAKSMSRRLQQYYTHVIDPRDKTAETSTLLDEIINKSYKFNPVFENTRRFLQGVVVL